MNNNYNKYFTETESGLDIEANNINANCITSQNNKFSLDSEGNLIVNSITAAVNNLNVDAIYPVGSIYMSVNSTSPSTLFGGTWERIQGRFLLGANDSSSAYNAGKTGGTISHNHSLNTDTAIASISLNNDGTIEYGETSVTANNKKTYRVTTGGTGGTISRETKWGAKLYGNTSNSNNMPPFLAVYIWKRTA